MLLSQDKVHARVPVPTQARVLLVGNPEELLFMRKDCFIISAV